MKIERLQALASLCHATDYDSSFSRGLRLDLGGARVVLISGTAAVGTFGESLHPRDVSAQTVRALRNIEALLADAGLSWHDVVWTNCYLRDITTDYGAFNAARRLFYEEKKLARLPASVCVEAKLCRPELLVEISAIAVRAEV